MAAQLKHNQRYVYSGGVIDKNFKFITISESRAEKNTFLGLEKFRLPCPEVRFLDEHTLYLGMCHQHFGHFLVETFSRLGFLKSAQDLREFDSISVLIEETGIPTFAKELFEMLGVGNRIRFIKHDTQFKKITILPQAIVYPNDVSKVISKLPSFFENDDGPLVKQKPLFISRTKLIPGINRIVIGEDIIESNLIQHGVDCIHPENMSLSEQIKAYKTHDVLIGSAGSAFHCLLVAGGHKKNFYYSSRKIPQIFKKIDNALCNENYSINAKYLEPLTLANGFSYGFKPEIINPFRVLRELVELNIIPSYKGELNQEVSDKMVRQFNASVLLRAVYVESQSKDIDWCQEFVNNFQKQHPVDLKILNRARQQVGIYRKIFPSDL